MTISKRLIPPSALHLKAALALVVALVSLTLGGCDNFAPEASTSLTDVHGIEDLKSRFNADTGSTRLILLLSPT